MAEETEYLLQSKEEQVMIKKVLMLIILASVIVSGVVLGERYNAEKRIKNVEIAVDMSDFQNLAGEAGISFEEMAKELIANKVTSIAVQESTLSNLSDKGLILYMPLGDLISGTYSKGAETAIAAQIIAAYQGKENTGEIYNSSVIITQSKYKDVYEFIYKALKGRVKVRQFKKDNTYALVVEQKLRGLEQQGLGFYEKDLIKAKELGFLSVIARVQNVVGIDEKGINDKIDQVKRNNVGTVIFGGETVLGYDEAKDEDSAMLKYAAQSFKERGLITAIIERPADENVEKVQKGIKAYAHASGYTSTKVFSAEFDTKRINSLQRIIEQWSRAIAERNVRIIYVRPMMSSYKMPEDNIDENLSAIRTLSERIENMGLNRDVVKGMGDIYPKPYERFIIFAGIYAGTVLLLMSFVELKNGALLWTILGIGALGLAGAFALNQFVEIMNTTLGDLLIKSAALWAAIIFPSLASAYLMNFYIKLSNKQEEKLSIFSVILKSVGMLLVAALISLIGGMMVAALLSESKYMLKLDIFRGVKLAFALPIIVYVALYIKKIGVYLDKDNKPINISLQIKKLLNTSVTIKYVLVGAIVLAGVAYLLARSGNAPANYTSGVEMEIRAYLENLFVARPRSKELFAFPILMLLVYSSMRRYRIFSFFIMFAGVIGLADIVNSFSHIRMPLQMSALSTTYSLIFGIVSGSVLIILWNLIEKGYNKNSSGRREIH